MNDRNPLDVFTSAALLDEVRRRQLVDEDYIRSQIRWCHNCANVRHWDKAGDPPRRFTVCGLGFKPDFMVPRDDGNPHSEDWGFYLPDCGSFIAQPGEGN